MENSLLLPARPRLRPGTEIVTVDHEKLLLRSTSGTVLLSGQFVASELPELLRLLDGTIALKDITEKVSENARPELERFLSIMMGKGLLCDGYEVGEESSNDHLSGKHSHEEAYWAQYESTTNDALNRLRSSTVLVANLGGVGLNVVRTLALSGVGKIIGIDSNNVRISDALFGYEIEDIGKPRVEAVSSYVVNSGLTSFVPISQSINDLSNFEELVSDADLIVLCSDNMSLADYDITNVACIQQKTPWISARIDRGCGVIGPFVVPEQTACFVCFEMRSRANSEHPADHEAIYRHWKNTESIPDNWPIIAPFVQLVGNYLALDILRVLAEDKLSVVFGRILYLDFHTFGTRFHEVIKLPRCPACSRERERPLTKIWDIRTKPAPEVHS